MVNKPCQNVYNDRDSDISPIVVFTNRTLAATI